jgi:hypothetical protein
MPAMSRIAGPARFLSFALMAFVLILSSAAGGAHSVAHSLTLAATDGGHLHAGATAPAAADRTAPDRDSQDGGHDHQLSLFFPVAALFGGAVLNPPPPVAAAPPSTEVATLALRPDDPPPADPPRAA